MVCRQSMDPHPSELPPPAGPALCVLLSHVPAKHRTAGAASPAAAEVLHSLRCAAGGKAGLREAVTARGGHSATSLVLPWPPWWGSLRAVPPPQSRAFISPLQGEQLHLLISTPPSSRCQSPVPRGTRPQSELRRSSSDLPQIAVAPAPGKTVGV